MYLLILIILTILAFLLGVILLAYNSWRKKNSLLGREEADLKVGNILAIIFAIVLIFTFIYNVYVYRYSLQKTSRHPFWVDTQINDFNGVVAQSIFQNIPKNLDEKCRIVVIPDYDNRANETSVENLSDAITKKLSEKFDKVKNKYDEKTLKDDFDAVFKFRTEHYLIKKGDKKIVRSYVTIKLFDVNNRSLMWIDNFMFDNTTNMTSELYTKIYLQSAQDSLYRMVDVLTKDMNLNTDRILIADLDNDMAQIIKDELIKNFLYRIYQRQINKINFILS